MSATPPISNSAPASIPLHMARAYGVQAPAGAGRAPQASAVGPASIASGPAAKLPSASQKLVGARVAGKVDFSGDAPVQRSASESLAMYRHPAEKNAAATAVSIGRSLDVSG